MRTHKSRSQGRKMGKAGAGVNLKLIALALVAVIAVGGVAAVYILNMPKPPGTLIIGTTDTVESCLDPARAYDYFGWAIIAALGSGLVEYRPGATGAPTDIVPALATSWSVSGDGLEWTFNLRHGVLYDDGSEFNATCVKYSYDRGVNIYDPDGAFGGIGTDAVIKNVTVVDKYTVKFFLLIPFSAFLSLYAASFLYIVDPKYAPFDSVVTYVDGDARASHTMGLGPYKLQSWSRVGGRDYGITLVANPNYWNASAGFPKTSTIVIKFYADATDLALAIDSGDVDIAFRQMTTISYNYLKTRPQLKVWDGTGAFIQYLCFQCNATVPPFNNVHARLGVAAAINRTAIVQTVFQGLASELFTMIPIGMSFHKDVFDGLGNPDYTKSRQELALAGYTNASKLAFDLWYESSGHYPQSAQQAAVLKDSLEKSGAMTVTLKSADWASYRLLRQAGSMPAFIMGWYPDYIDADDYIQPFYDTTGSSWIHLHWSNATMDNLILWARGNTTGGVRNSLYSTIQDISVQESPIVPLYQGTAFAVSKIGIGGIYLDITQNFRYWYLYGP
jgi:peptide/nickel transport system substrate-binding protein